jgi:uncharacterized protein
MALEIADRFGFAHRMIQTAELERAEYRSNPTNRCYYCKHELYEHLTAIAGGRGAVIVDGNNADDRGDYRPGRQAAREFGVRSPLERLISSKTRFASCPGTWVANVEAVAWARLSSRIPYHRGDRDKLRPSSRPKVPVLGFRVPRPA